MPRSKIQFEQMKDERKASILNAALVLFSLYENKVTIDMISNKAKCSHGLVYHYYDNVDDVLIDLKNSDSYSNIKNSLAKIDTNISAFKNIENIIKTLDSFNKINDIAFANLILLEKDKNSFYDILIKLIKKSQNENEIINGLPNDIANNIILIYKGYYLSYLLNKKTSVVKPDVNYVIDTFKKYNY